MTEIPWWQLTEDQKTARIEVERAKADALRDWPGSTLSTAYGDFLTAVMEAKTLVEVESLREGLTRC